MDEKYREAERELSKEPETVAAWSKFGNTIRRSGGGELAAIISNCGARVKSLLLQEAEKVSQWPTRPLVVRDEVYAKHLDSYEGHAILGRSAQGGRHRNNSQRPQFLLVPQKGLYRCSEWEDSVDYVLRGEQLVHTTGRGDRIDDSTELPLQSYITLRNSVLSIIDELYQSSAQAEYKRKPALARLFTKPAEPVAADASARNNLQTILDAAGAHVAEVLRPQTTTRLASANMVVIAFEPELQKLAGYTGHYATEPCVTITADDSGPYLIGSGLVSMPTANAEFESVNGRIRPCNSSWRTAPKISEQKALPGSAYLERLPELLGVINTPAPQQPQAYVVDATPLDDADQLFDEV